jgi:hypothetical protein
MPDYSIWNEGAYQFVIANRNQRKSPNDPEVKEALQSLRDSSIPTKPFYFMCVKQVMVRRHLGTDYFCGG